MLNSANINDITPIVAVITCIQRWTNIESSCREIKKQMAAEMDCVNLNNAKAELVRLDSLGNKVPNIE